MSKTSLAAQFDRFDELQAGLNAARFSLINQINTADIDVDVLSSHALKSGGDVDILMAISNRGINLAEITDPKTGNTLMHIAVGNTGTDDLAAASIRYLKAKEVPFDTSNFEGHTPLHCAALQGYEMCFFNLARYGASLTNLDVKGCNVLQLANQGGSSNIAYYIQRDSWFQDFMQKLQEEKSDQHSSVFTIEAGNRDEVELAGAGANTGDPHAGAGGYDHEGSA